MKTILISCMALLATMGIQAQNKNVTGIQKTTVTTVKDSEGEKQILKTKEIQEVQDIEFQDADSNDLNKSLKQSPVQVTSTTTVTNPDGSTRTVDIDRSAYYDYNGQNYQLKLDPAGYAIVTPDNKKVGVLRATSTNSYIYRGKKSTSVGYFDTNGNLVLETYDDKSDKVTIETYMRSQQ